MATLASAMARSAPIADVAENRQRLCKMLQLHGYSACREALVLLEDHYTSSTKYESLEDFISTLNKVITFDTDAGTSIIDPDLAHQAIQKLCNADKKQQVVTLDGEPGDTHEQQRPHVPAILVVKVKNVAYNQCTDKRRVNKSNIDGTKFIASQTDEFSIHYNFLFKRLSDLPVFQGEFKLIKLDRLTASNQQSIRCICFGLLIKDVSKIDGYMLIDSSGRVPVRITPETSFRNRLAYSNCLVIVEGVYINPDDVLFAANIGLPPVLLDPLEEKSLACASDKLVVVLKELYLDDEDVCSALDMLFTGYNSMDDPPAIFILIGDFTRETYEPHVFRTHMKKLIRILRTCDNLRQCHFVFVPGQRDTSPASLDDRHDMPKGPLTRDQLPANLLQLSHFENIHLATNPAHIYLGNRQISVVAHSYVKELRKNILHDLSDHREELFETVKQIILSNGHLTAGTNKTYHSSMNLWHRPDLLVLADTEAFGNRYDFSSSATSDTSFMTVPSFSRQFNQFKVYYLKSGDIEDSQVSQDALREVEAVEEANPSAQMVENVPSELDDD